jgi:hypothetical protein
MSTNWGGAEGGSRTHNRRFTNTLGGHIGPSQLLPPSTDGGPSGTGRDALAQGAQGSNRGQTPRWQVRALLDAAAWCRERRLPYCRWIAVKAIA